MNTVKVWVRAVQMGWGYDYNCENININL